ncbi:50S ribosome-binding GTPase [Patescibacteria group bacterium]|nr:50S ribosome-binding GTPase [Patescibacteria group bacterium]
MTRGLGRTKKAAKRKSPKTNKHRIPVVSLIDKIIWESDIVLEILDVRFIEKSRNLEIEDKVKRFGKVLIYVLNKSDLVNPNDITKNIELEKIKPYLFFSSKERKGAHTLREIIKIKSEKLDKSPIIIGVIGYPNSGKSSLINYLIGKSSAKTSSEAGYTKGIQKLKLSKGVYLIDTPGVIPPYEKTEIGDKGMSKLPRIGAITWNKIKNPEMVVFRLTQQYPYLFEKHYKIEAKGNSEVLIEKLGRKLNYLKKGNIVDEDRTSKRILRDWQEGKISFFDST